MFSDKLIHCATELLQACRTRGLTIATAESCTGGLVSALLTEISGSSDVFLGGFITYANEAKIRDVAVPADLISRKGAVSEEVARAMAEGARIRSGASLAVSITGVAGPSGGTAEKPVGMVCIAVASEGGTRAETCHFKGDRTSVRLQSVSKALEMLRAVIPSPLEGEG